MLNPRHSLLQALDSTARHHVLAATWGDEGVDLHWREWGQGRPLVLLHGGKDFFRLAPANKQARVR